MDFFSSKKKHDLKNHFYKLIFKLILISSHTVLIYLNFTLSTLSLSLLQFFKFNFMTN